MSKRDYSRLIIQLRVDEGWRSTVYKDSVGVSTVGYGRNLDHKGLSKQEGMYLLQNDVREVIDQMSQHEWFNQLNHVRQDVMLNMCFNLGYNGLMKFKNTIRYIKAGDYERAADNLTQSKWYIQVGDRAVRLVKMMRTGQYLD